MINKSLLNSVSSRLEIFRKGTPENPVPDIIFDGRDKGNYLSYSWPDTVEMLRRHDPTGLCEAMLLDAMIEATIDLSKVKLSSVLREIGFIERLAEILDIKDDLSRELDNPREALIGNITGALGSVSADFQAPSSKEVAICLRDAIYSIDSGLKLRWLDCSSHEMDPYLKIQPEIRQFKDIKDFVCALRWEMPPGAHMARIGVRGTAMGMKAPGRVAYLSSMSVSIETGKIKEHRATNQHMAEKLDLDTAVERYPEWIQANVGRVVELSGADTHLINTINKLDRSCLIWFAMVTHMTAQHMAQTPVNSVELSEVLALALPSPSSSKPGNLPALFNPNWTMRDPGLVEIFNNLGLSVWESKFLKPSIEGFKLEDFLPEKPSCIDFETRKIEQSVDPDAASLSQKNDQDERTISLITVSSDWVGSKNELSQARISLAKRNLTRWIYAWGNHQFEKEIKSHLDYFKQKISQSWKSNLEARCLAIETPDEGRGWTMINIFSQSKNHKTYKPVCCINGKSAVTHVLRFTPENDSDLVKMLGLSEISELPEFLRGWERAPEIANEDRYRREDGRRWVFAKKNGFRDDLFISAIVQVNENNLDNEMRKQIGLPEKEVLSISTKRKP